MDKTVLEEEKIEKKVGNIIDQDRVVAFSDAVFAFAATLLVLKIEFPPIEAELIGVQFAPALQSLWPQYLANIISFLIIGFYWLSHHAIFGLIKKFNGTVVWLNIIFLVGISFLPFPVDLYGDYFNIPIVVAFYCASLSVTGFMLFAIWIYASYKKKLVDSSMSPRRMMFYNLEFLIAPVVFLCAVPIAFIFPYISQLAWIFIIIGLVMINKHFKYKSPGEIEKMSAA